MSAVPTATTEQAPAVPVPASAPAEATQVSAPASSQGEGAQTSVPSQAAGDETKTSTLKPIPDRTRDDTGRFQKDLKRHDLGFKPKEERDGSPEQPFPGKKPAQTPTPPVAAKPGEAPLAPADQTAQPEAKKVSWGGREWASMEEAEHSYKTVTGMFRANALKAEEESRKAKGWYDRAIQLGHNDQTPAGAQPPATASGAAPKPSEEESDPLKGLGPEVMGVYEQLVQSDPLAAPAYIASEVAKNTEARVMAKVKELIAPFAQSAERQQVSEAIGNVYEWAERQVDSAGQPAYPELSDQASAAKISEIWGWLTTEGGLDSKVAHSPMGLHIAALIHRDMASRGAASVAIPPASTPNAPNQAAAAVAQALLQSPPSGDVVSGPSARTTTPGGTMTREQQVLRDIREARVPDPELGFRRRSTPLTI